MSGGEKIVENIIISFSAAARLSRFLLSWSLDIYRFRVYSGADGKLGVRALV